MRALPFPTDFEEATRSAGAGMRRRVDTRAGNPRMHWEVAVNGAWKAVPVAGEKEIWAGERSLAEFESPDSERARISVTMEPLDREVGPGDLLEVAVERAGEGICERRDAYGRGGLSSDILSTRPLEDGNLVRRSVAVKDGERLFYISGCCREEDYESLAHPFLISTHSFRLMHPECRDLVETLQHHRPDSPSGISFSFPGSWRYERAEAPGDPPVAMARTRVVNRHGSACIGIVQIDAFGRGDGLSPASLARGYVEELRSRGLQVQGALLSPQEDPRGFREVHVSDLTATDGEKDLVCPLIVLGHEEGWLRLSLLGVERDVEGGIWAMNKRGFEIIRDTLRTSAMPRPTEAEGE